MLDAETLYSGSKGRLWLRLFVRRGSRIAFIVLGGATLLLGRLALSGLVDLSQNLLQRAGHRSEGCAGHSRGGSRRGASALSPPRTSAARR